jgi:CHAD domain-containing protein
MLREVIGVRDGEDPEAVHDMRVAVRRIRLALDVFRPGLRDKPSRRLAKRLKAVGNRLGRVREADVLLEGFDAYQRRRAARRTPSGEHPLRAHWMAAKVKAHGRLVAHIESEAFVEDCAAVEEFIREPPRSGVKKARGWWERDEIRLAAPILILGLWNHVRAADPVWGAVTLEELHSLRLGVKSTRYALEFLSDILGPETPGLIKDLRRLQDHLGGFTDADVSCQRVQTFLSEWTEEQQGLAPKARPHPRPVVTYLAACHSRRHHALRRLETAWRAFPQERFRRRLAEAVSRP